LNIHPYFFIFHISWPLVSLPVGLQAAFCFRKETLCQGDSNAAEWNHWSSHACYQLYHIYSEHIDECETRKCLIPLLRICIFSGSVFFSRNTQTFELRLDVEHTQKWTYQDTPTAKEIDLFLICDDYSLLLDWRGIIESIFTGRNHQ